MGFGKTSGELKMTSGRRSKGGGKMVGAGTAPTRANSAPKGMLGKSGAGGRTASNRQYVGAPAPSPRLKSAPKGMLGTRGAGGKAFKSASKMVGAGTVPIRSKSGGGGASSKKLYARTPPGANMRGVC